MSLGARSEFGAPMFEPEVFRKQMCCIEESVVTFLGPFGAPAVIRRPGNCAPHPPVVTHLHRCKLLMHGLCVTVDIHVRVGASSPIMLDSIKFVLYLSVCISVP